MLPSVVVCGTFHRDWAGLCRLFRELEATGCRVLSPISIDFVNQSIPVVRTEHEQDFTIHELEKFHLRAMRTADFILFHAPEGHIGLSGAYEIGYANALGKPVFSKHLPSDEMLATQVRAVGSVFEILELLQFIA
jgi:nucleoside 2-deoxyribosyltransferase